MEIFKIKCLDVRTYFNLLLSPLREHCQISQRPFTVHGRNLQGQSRLILPLVCSGVQVQDVTN